MTIYKLYKYNGDIAGASYETLLGTCFFGFNDTTNTDYAQFKKNILEGAELFDAEGKAMTSAQAIAFVKELP
jgi:hypothetical protein